MAERRLRLVVAYRGTPFRGWADNEGVRSVEATLRRAIEQVLGHEVALDVAGRTDAGVHAVGQVVSLTTTATLAAASIVPAVNARCGPDVAVQDAVEVDHDFHARFSAVARRYRYRILNRAVRDPLRCEVTWHVRHPLDLDALAAATAPLVGEHDFASFCRRPKLPHDASTVRRVTEATWGAAADELHFEIEANAFCHQMVRSLVGLLVAIGVGRRRPSEVVEVLAARDRGAVRADIAPPCGLTLVAVRY